MGLISSLFSTLFGRRSRLTLEQAQQLSDEELTAALYQALEVDTPSELAALPEPVRFVYAILQYQAEVNNGGLCQYFVNSSRITAPCLEQALTAVGAQKHCRHFHDFVTKNAIDVHDLRGFIIEDVSEFETLNESLPFDDYDEAFYALYEEENPDALTAAYIRNNINTFFTKK